MATEPKQQPEAQDTEPAADSQISRRNHFQKIQKMR